MEVLNRSAAQHVAAHCGPDDPCVLVAVGLPGRLVPCRFDDPGNLRPAIRSRSDDVHRERLGRRPGLSAHDDHGDADVPNVADRTLTVELSLRSVYSRDYDLRLTQDIEIPAGSGPVEAAVSIPRLVAWNNIDLNVVEDGQLLKPLSAPTGRRRDGDAVRRVPAADSHRGRRASEHEPLVDPLACPGVPQPFEHADADERRRGDVYPGAVSQRFGQVPPALDRLHQPGHRLPVAGATGPLGRTAARGGAGMDRGGRKPLGVWRRREVGASGPPGGSRRHAGPQGRSGTARLATAGAEAL